VVLCLLAACAVALASVWWVRRTSEARLRAILDEAPIAYHEIDRAGIIRRVNRAECELLGYEEHELIGRPVVDLVASDQQHLAYEAIRRKFSGRAELVPFERDYIRRDGSRIKVRIHETAVRDRYGRIVTLRSAVVDVTGSRLAEEALRESEERYRRLFENARIGIYRSTPDGRIVAANPALVQMLGYSSFSEMEHLDLNEAVGKAYNRAEFQTCMEREGEVRNREAVLETRNGTQIRVLESASAVRGGHGRVLFYEGIMEDVTERRRAEEQLRASEERYRRLFEDANDIFYTHDLEGVITSANRAAERTLGYSRSELIGMNISQLLAPGAAERAMQFIACALAGETPPTRELRIRTRGGRWVLLEVSPRLICEGGRPVGMFGIARDITERKRYEREIQRKNEELEAALAAARDAVEAKSRFLANVSHEIRTPMNGIVGMTELLLRTELTAEQREFAAAVKTSAETLLALVNDVLALSKGDAGKLELRRAPYSPERLVREVSAVLRAQAEGKGVELRTVCAQGMPAAVMGDESRVRQVLINLASNGVKFTERGWVEVRSGVEEAANGRALRFEVQDTGIGIPQEHSARIFETFSQVDSSITRKHGGAGLGLAVSRQLVEHMGGRIGFESRPGEGSTFWFTLPLEPAAADLQSEPVAAGLRMLEGERPAAVRSARILLAEDSGLNRRIALRMLAEMGLTADAVANGRLAVEAAASSTYDLILMDVHMPEMDGFTATREIRRAEATGRHTPIVAMTARAMGGDREQCIAAGMDDYISKPVRFEELRAVVDRWVGARAQTPAVPV
jgi:two-component system sensor histidine kinase/response regulator